MKTTTTTNKGRIGIIITVSLLLTAIAGFAYLNAGSVAALKELEMEAEFY